VEQFNSQSRRKFMRIVAGASSLGLGIMNADNDQNDNNNNEDPPRGLGKKIEHVVVLTMENRSLDHFLGWMPNIDGKQAGLTYLDKSGAAHATHPLAPDYQGCGHPDPDHSYTGGRVEYDNGACDGWLRAGSNDDFSIGYYKQSDLPFLGQAAPSWTTFSRYFAATMAETYPNRIYTHAAQTDRDTNTTNISTLPTIWDRLLAANVPCRYYFSDVPFLALWGAKYLPISRPFPSFLADCAAGTLPAVSYVDPRFIDESSGTSGDDHPHADIRNGEAFMNLVYSAVTLSPNWSSTVFIITFDEWGGFFDHVPPQTAPDANPKFALRGFRVPCLLISPWTRRGFVSTDVFDHTSFLKMIEWRWNLQPLTVRDANANNLANALNLHSSSTFAPIFAVPPGPFGGPCAAPAALAPRVPDTEWSPLVSLARSMGWPV
jgi:phospholipase C